MNSKEALEFLTEGICNCTNCSKYAECMELDEHESVCENAKFIIKKDLVRLEQLEIANKNNEGLVRDNVKLMNRNLELQDENKNITLKFKFFRISRQISSEIS